jgi:hypothetical protein
MGRPPKKPEDRKSYQLHVPLTEAQHAIIRQAVELSGDDKAEWAREILLQEAKREIARSQRKGSREA